MAEDGFDYTRRDVMAVAGTALGVGLAGCSDNTSSTPTDQNEDEVTGDDGNSGSGETTNGGSGSTEGSEPETGNLGEDNVLEGEEQFEEFIASNEYGGSDVNTERYWIEFESPQDQIEVPVTDQIDESAIEDLIYVVENGERPEGLGSLDALYLAVEEDSDNPVVAEFYFNEDEWDTSAEPVQNMGNGGFGSPSGEEVPLDSLEAFFSENVQAYNDVSDDIPQEYLDLVEE